MSSIEIGGVSHELNEINRRREEALPEGKRQVRQRRAQRADGGVHAVKHGRGKTVPQEIADAHEVDRGPVKRWQPAYALPTLPDPPGFSLCWVSRHGRNRGDEAGVIKALQEGWEFARKSEFPKHVLPTQRLSDHGSVIGNDSTVLMKLPEEFKAQRDAHYNGKRDAATRAVTRRSPGLPEATRQMPLVEDRNDVQVKMEPVRVKRRSGEAEA